MQQIGTSRYCFKGPVGGTTWCDITTLHILDSAIGSGFVGLRLCLGVIAYHPQQGIYNNSYAPTYPVLGTKLGRLVKMCKIELSITLLSISGLSMNFSTRQIALPTAVPTLSADTEVNYVTATGRLQVRAAGALYSMPVQGAALNCCIAFSLTLVPTYEHDVTLRFNAVMVGWGRLGTPAAQSRRLRPGLASRSKAAPGYAILPPGPRYRR